MADLRAKDLMTKNVITIKPDITIRELSDVLLKNNISGVPVVDDEGKLIGIVTEADIIKENIKVQFPFYFDPLMVSGYVVDFEKYNADIKDYLNTPVEEIMSRRVKTATPQTPLNEVADIMVYNKVNRVPIVDENKKVVGIITRADIIKTMITK
ncbi:MAG: CBS domain-containing protein [Actinobacteria bacterium]|nr:CBS domain-containing protein [Cyanobacteriota bacterium]MCL5770947.1 CBS domain-containing protein [Actinomycetota bacterium]